MIRSGIPRRGPQAENSGGTGWLSPDALDQSGLAYLNMAFDIFDPDVRYGNGEYQEVPASLTLPQPQNSAQRRALDAYLDSLEDATGIRPKIVFEAPPAQEVSRWTGEPLGETAELTQSAGQGQSH